MPFHHQRPQNRGKYSKSTPTYVYMKTCVLLNLAGLGLAVPQMLATHAAEPTTTPSPDERNNKPQGYFHLSCLSESYKLCREEYHTICTGNGAVRCDLNPMCETFCGCIWVDQCGTSGCGDGKDNSEEQNSDDLEDA